MKKYEKPSAEVVKLAIEEGILVEGDKELTSDTIPDLGG